MPKLLEDETLEVKITPDYSKEHSRTYANYMQVSHDEVGFTLTFCDNRVEMIAGMKDKLEKDADGKLRISCPVVAQIIVSPLFIPKILEAIKQNYDRFQNKPRITIKGQDDGDKK